jgi:hypothetical protein
MMKSVFIAAMLAVAIPSTAAEFQSEMPPGEGPLTLVAKANAPLFVRPDKRSKKVIGDEVKKGEILGRGRHLYRALKPGRIIVTSPFQVQAHSYGAIDLLTRMSSSTLKTFSFEPGDLIEYLQYRSEGFCVLRIGNEVIEAPEPDSHRTTIKAKPVNEWWVLALGSFESERGWALVDGRRIARKGL